MLSLKNKGKEARKSHHKTYQWTLIMWEGLKAKNEQKKINKRAGRNLGRWPISNHLRQPNYKAWTL